ncbi:MAG: hypothetical protein Q7T03_06470 [Deltaproteobacteria bacterium]|nr:hypothetical protein [Deltaproteobacteria bacterium]
MADVKPVITDLSSAALVEELAGLGFKPFATVQIVEWLYQKRVPSFEEMTNLSKEARQKLSDHFAFSSTKVSDLKTSIDGTCLFVFE